MVIAMKPDASEEDVQYVIRRVRSLGLEPHVSCQNGQTLIGLAGDVRALSPDTFAGLSGVEKAQALTKPFRLASKEFRGMPTIVPVGDLEIGGKSIVVMGGPCSVETAAGMVETAKAIRKSGATMLRGGAFKPRSSPYNFQGLAEEGLEILAAARKETGLSIITEVMSSEQVPLVCRYADVLQIGTRNMQNYALLNAVGETRLPVLLKRGMMCTIQEFLLSAEYILSHGNPNVILCERGIRTFETYTRNSLDINAVPALKELSHLPVVVDPSHATGKASLVNAVSRAAVAAGADGLLIEVHPDPDNAWSDGFQSLTFAQFDKLMTDLKPIAEAVGRSL